MRGTTRLARVGLVVLAVAAAALLGTAHARAAMPSFGPNVVVLSPTMPQSAIQAQLDAISTQQVPSQFGTGRYAVLFEPGTYGSAANPLDFQVGYYTQVAGLGTKPSDVVINGAINVFNQCSGGACNGLTNFWRSLSNLTLNVDLPSTPPAYAPYSGDAYGAGCDNSAEMWAVSQASPMRSVIVNGSVVISDYCNPNFFTSGGFFANDEFSGAVDAYTQQQFLTRNSNIGSWSNGVWNDVFLGDAGAPPTSFGPGTNQYTTLPSTPVAEDPPFLTVDSSGNWSVFVPKPQQDTVGPSYAGGAPAGTSIPISRFFIASPSTPVLAIDAALALGKNLILTPGVYDLPLPITVLRPDQIVLGLGFATLIPTNGTPAVVTTSVPGIKLSGLIVDAGPVNSPVLVQVGGPLAGGTHDPNDPTLLSDLFFRIGGAEPGQAKTSLVVDSDNAILDDVWAWRADHGAGVGWTQNRADTGVIVNGDNVTAYGLFVEHYQRNEVIWNGQNGEDVFFQNEMPYDPPNQAAWMSSPTTDGYPAFVVAPGVKSFQGYGMGSYSFFNQGVPVFAAEAFHAPTTPGVQFHDILTVFLDAVHGSGGIQNVIDGTGGPSTAANADVPVDVVSYP
jgi:hypothetical protein